MNKGSKIICLGNIGIDVAVTPDGRNAHAAGTALRCSLGAAVFGVGLTPTAVIGGEPEYIEPLERLSGRGADLSRIVSAPHSITFTTTYDTVGNITNFHIDHESVMADTATVCLSQPLDDAKMVVLCPLPFTALNELADRAHTAHAEVFMVLHYAQFTNTPPPDFLPLIAKVDWLVLNADEARRITQLDDVDAAGALLSRTCRRGIFLTMAERGATAWVAGDRVAHLPTLAPIVTNLLGAGDTFSGGVVAGLNLTDDPAVALTYGLLAASLVVARPNHELLMAALPSTNDK